MNAARRAYAPGRVNLIGDHTDYSGGLVLPMAIDRGTSVVLHPGGERIVLISEAEDEPAIVNLDPPEPSTITPPWARYIAGVASVVRPAQGGTGRVTTTLPVGAGLSSSAALEVAAALALGFEGTPLALAQACQEAEHRASGVPCGIMDQLISVAGVVGHALLINCTSLATTPIRLPPDIEVFVVHSGESRTLVGSAYAERRRQVTDAAAILGAPLGSLSVLAVERLANPVLRRRARHVIDESSRVLAFVDAVRHGDVTEAGQLMNASHASLRDDFEVSTPALDSLVEVLQGTNGVLGARLTGAGFGGCAVALARPGTSVRFGQGWTVRASAGATINTDD
jgi:galactokinase